MIRCIFNLTSFLLVYLQIAHALAENSLNSDTEQLSKELLQVKNSLNGISELIDYTSVGRYDLTEEMLRAKSRTPKSKTGVEPVSVATKPASSSAEHSGDQLPKRLIDLKNKAEMVMGPEIHEESADEVTVHGESGQEVGSQTDEEQEIEVEEDDEIELPEILELSPNPTSIAKRDLTPASEGIRIIVTPTGEVYDLDNKGVDVNVVAENKDSNMIILLETTVGGTEGSPKQLREEIEGTDYEYDDGANYELGPFGNDEYLETAVGVVKDRGLASASIKRRYLRNPPSPHRQCHQIMARY